MDLELGRNGILIKRLLRRDRPLRESLHRPRRPRFLPVALVLFAVAVGLIGWRILAGPIPVSPLARLIEAEAEKVGVPLTIERATIDLTGGGAVVAIENAVAEPPGERVRSAVLPRLEADVVLRSILAGRLDIRNVRLQQPSLTIAVDDRPRQIPDMKDLTETIDRIAARAADEMDRRGVESVTITAGEILVEGRTERRFSGIDLTVRPEDAGALTAEAAVSGRVGRWRAAFSRSLDPGTGTPQISFSARDVTIGEFMPVDAELVPGRGLGIPMSSRFDATFDTDGAFANADLSIAVSAGWINTGKTPVSFDAIDVRLAWQAGSPVIRLGPSRYVLADTIIPLEGRITPPTTSAGVWSYEIMSDNAQLSPRDVPGSPLLIDVVQVVGSFDLTSRLLNVDRLTLRTGTAQIDGAGSVEFSADGPYLALALESGPMPVATAKRLWPITVTPPAREWFIEHVIEGRIDSARADISLQPAAFNNSDPEPGWSGNDLSVQILASDVALKTIGTLPVVQGLDGTIAVADEILIVEARDGEALATGHGTVTVPDATFRIPNLKQAEGKIGELTVNLEGDAPSLGSVLDSKPIGALSRYEIAPSDLSGTGRMTVDVTMPLRRALTIGDIQWRVSGTLSDFANSKPIRGNKIENGNLTFQADPQQFALQGKGRLDGLTADLDLVVPLAEVGGAGGVTAKQDIVLEVTAEQLAARGIDLTSNIDGPLTLAIDDSPEGQDYRIDLTRARINLAEIGWRKAAGASAQARFTMISSERGRQLKNLVLTSEGTEIRGEVVLDAKGDLVEASFPTFRLRPSDSASLKVEKDRQNRLTVLLRGEQFDARGLIAQFREKTGGGKENTQTIDVSAALDRVLGFNGVTATGVKLDLKRTGGRLRSLALTGATGGRNAFDIALQTDRSGQSLTGSFGDTGEALRFLDLYKRMRGGTGRLSVAMPTNQNWSGRATITNLSLTGDPAIKQLTNMRRAGDREGGPLLANGAARRGEASFQTMEVQFTRRGDVLTVTEGTLTGPSIGGTISGTADLASQTLDMTGTFVPMYALNNLFAKIPVLGFALGGGTDEGLIGVTYRLSGPLTAPVLSVNPMSAIAPGLFRKMFEYR